MIDLHVHSSISDGHDSIEQIMKSAQQEKLKVLSFVDHDTTETYNQAQPVAKRYGIELIPGIEISAFDFKRNRKVHVLGYGYTDTAHIEQLCQPLLERRHQHSLWQLQKIKESGQMVDEAIINQRLEHGTLYKQHIMNAITNAPYTDETYQAIYKKLFKTGVAKGDIEYLDVYDALHAIKNDGGKTVIAHPGQLNSFDLVEEILKNDATLIDGIETFHYDHSDEDIKHAHRIAKQYDLIETGGSDYHGRFGANYTLGYYTTSKKNYEKLSGKNFM